MTKLVGRLGVGGRAPSTTLAHDGNENEIEIDDEIVVANLITA